MARSEEESALVSQFLRQMKYSGRHLQRDDDEQERKQREMEEQRDKEDDDEEEADGWD